MKPEVTTPQMMTSENSATIRDALYLAMIMIHDRTIIENPFKETLKRDQIEDVLNKITIGGYRDE